MIVAKNIKAQLEYAIADTLEAGVALVGEEIKAVRARKVSINGSYVRPFANKSGKTELWWLGGHFQSEKMDQTRSRKLLLHRSEIKKITGHLTAGDATLLPIELYLNHGIVKLKIGFGTRKNKADRREELRRKDLDRDAERDLSSR